MVMLVPSKVGDNWRILHRPMLNVLHDPESVPGKGGKSGLSDLTYEAFFTPNKNSRILWGIGPAFLFPTATSAQFGTGKWAAGPAVGVVSQPGRWSFGVVASNLWSFAGNAAREPMNELSLEPFVDYNLNAGWFLSCHPGVSADWNAPRADRWVVPLGGGFGKAFALGRHSAVVSALAYYNLERPTGASNWEMHLGVQFLFAK
jgi:hypothetical protein